MSQDDTNYLVALEDELLRRFGGGNDRLVAEAKISSATKRALVHQLFRHYGLQHKTVIAKQLVELPQPPSAYHNGSEDEEDFCWDCPADNAQPIRKQALSKLVLVELPPANKHWPPADRLTNPADSTCSKSAEFLGIRWHIAHSSLKNYTAAQAFQQRRRQIVYTFPDQTRCLRTRRFGWCDAQ